MRDAQKAGDSPLFLVGRRYNEAAMGLPDFSKPYDPSVRAEVALDRMLDETSVATVSARANTAAVSAELRKQRILEAESTRVKSRILFVTTDIAVFTADSITARTFIDLQEVFDEIHIMVIGQRGALPKETVRLAPSVWAYPLVTKFFIQIPFAAKGLAEEELEFADGFRPDLVVALDPFESGAAALFIADHFERPLQVHVRTDAWIQADKFLKADKYNPWRMRFMHYVMKRTDSVRVSTDSIKTALLARYKKITDLELLPRFFNTSQLLNLPARTEQKKYPQFVFTIMCVSELDAESTLFRALDAVRMSLQTPSIGFVVVGDGPLKQQFRDRAKILQIERQVIFAGSAVDYTEYLRSADVLLVTDTNAESDDLVIKAAALGIPMIMARTPLRVDLFKDGTDTFMCDPDDAFGFAQKLRTFINMNALRMQFSSNGREIIRTRIEEDPQLYRIAYRDSIERMLYVAAEAAGIAAAAEAKPAPAPKPVIIDGNEMKVPEDDVLRES